MSRDSDEFDLFVSYARADDAEGWVSRFVEALLSEHRRFAGGRELSCFFDRQAIRSLDDWRERIFNDGIARSRLFLAFVSPRYFASEWCRREWQAWIDTEIAKHILSNGAQPIYFIEVPGFVGGLPGLREQALLGESDVARRVAEMCGLPAPLEDFVVSASRVVCALRERRQLTADFVRPFADEGLDALRREDLRAKLAGLARDLEERARQVRGAGASESTIPAYNRRFSGRLDELTGLRERLKDDRAGVICGVHGLGGIGKTELAFTYAHAYGGVYPGGRFLVTCEGKRGLREALLGTDSLTQFFRAGISDDERRTAESYFAALVRCLRERIDRLGHVLLVLDNVTDAAVVLPQETDALTSLGSKLHLLATTRLPAPPGAGWLTLGELREPEALDLLEKHRPFADDAEREAARRVVRRLGGFALAVELVAVWLAAHPGSSYAGLVDRIGLEDLEDIAEDADVALRRHNHERRVSAVLGPVLEELGPVERRALEYASLLPPDHVPLPWLRELVARDLPRELQATGRTDDPWREAWERLARLALMSRADRGEDEPRLVRVHRLVQDLVKGRLDASSSAGLQDAVDALIDERVGTLKGTTRWEAVRWELESLDALAALWAESSHDRASSLMNAAAGLWYRLAEWARVEPLMRRALAIDEASYGPDHPRVATRLNNLAQLLKATNRLAEAEPLMRRALAIDEASYGPHHPNVGIRLNNLASLLLDTNRLAEAEPLMRRALAIDEASYGQNHPEVATDINNLAALLKATNRLAEAEPLMRRALAIDEASYGPHHPSVATDLNNLASLLLDTNRLAEAEPLSRRHLEVFLRFTRDTSHEHPHLQAAVRNYADILAAMGRSREQILAALNEIGTSFGVSFGGG